MKKCKHCNVNILDDTVTCPLCNRVLKEDDEASGTKMYPDIERERKKFMGIKNTFYVLSVLTGILMLVINFLVGHEFWWAVIVDAGILYLMLTVSYSVIHRRNPAAKILVETIGASAFVAVIDYVTGKQGWALDYAIPGLVLLADFAIVALMIANRGNWYSYLIYQVILTVLCCIPLILCIVGIAKHPVVILVAVGISVGIVIFSMMFGKGKSELARRLHT